MRNASWRTSLTAVSAMKSPTATSTPVVRPIQVNVVFDALVMLNVFWWQPTGPHRRRSGIGGRICWPECQLRLSAAGDLRTWVLAPKGEPWHITWIRARMGDARGMRFVPIAGCRREVSGAGAAPAMTGMGPVKPGGRTGAGAATVWLLAECFHRVNILTLWRRPQVDWRCNPVQRNTSSAEAVRRSGLLTETPFT
jgi:hypothetical protein